MEADFHSNFIKRSSDNFAQLILHTTAILSFNDLLWLSLLFLCIYLFLLKESPNFILSFLLLSAQWGGWGEGADLLSLALTNCAIAGFSSW